MLVTFYNNASAANVVHKHLANVGSKTCNVTAPVDIDEINIYVDSLTDLINANYVHVSALSRYYFIKDRQIINGNQFMITASCDPLTTFWDKYKGSQCIADRSSNKFDPYIEDDLLAKKPTYKYIYRRMTNAFTPSASGHHYLLTMGGGE